MEYELRATLNQMKYCGRCKKKHEDGAKIVFGNKDIGKWLCEKCYHEVARLKDQQKPGSKLE